MATMDDVKVVSGKVYDSLTNAERAVKRFEQFRKVAIAEYGIEPIGFHKLLESGLPLRRRTAQAFEELRQYLAAQK